MIIEKASRGEKDFIKHSCQLFVNLVAMFVRLLIILLRRNDEKKQSKKK